MKKIPEGFEEDSLSLKIQKAGLPLISRGKVRDTYEIGIPELRLVVASNRISIDDIVLPAFIPGKGRVLTMVSNFFMESVLSHFDNHLIATGARIDEYLPEALKNCPDLQGRGVVISVLEMLPFEFIVRGYLTGSGLKAYNKTGEVCGHKLPTGLHDGAKLPEPIFTPTTKAVDAHDEHVTFESLRQIFGDEPERLALNVYKTSAEFAEKKGFILADTKYEFGRDNSGRLVIGDEADTPDSSRFWLRHAWKEAVEMKKSPAGYDKQPVREWGKTVVTPFTKEGSPIIGIGNLDLDNPEHIDFVHKMIVPEEVIRSCAERYEKLAEMLLI